MMLYENRNLRDPQFWGYYMTREQIRLDFPAGHIAGFYEEMTIACAQYDGRTLPRCTFVSWAIMAAT